MARRQFLSRLAALPFFAIAASALPPTSNKTLNIMEKSAWGSDDPTRASFPFLHALALADAGHNVQIFLLGEAVGLMRKSVADAIVPVGWPRWPELWKRSWPKRFRSTLEGRAPAHGPWRKVISTNGVRSSEVRQFCIAGGMGGQSNYRMI